MQIQKLTKIDEYVIRIEPGEKLMANLERFMRDRQYGYVTFDIPTGGGIVDIECSFSEQPEKGGSKEHKLDGPMELGGTGGNIAWDRNNPSTPLVHCHIGLGDEEGLRGYVAHLKEATVKLTAEIKIEAYEEKVFRKVDERVGLMLLDLPKYSSIDQGKTSKPSNEQGGCKEHSEEIERLKKELEKEKEINAKVKKELEEKERNEDFESSELKKKIRELRKQNTDLNKTNTELSGRLVRAEISVPPKE